MYKIHEKFPDFDGNMVEADFYFNLTEAEITEMQYGITGGMVSMLNKIIGAKSTPELIKYFKDIILRSYGVKDGIHFRKSDAIRDDFASTNAYSQIYMRLATDEKAAQDFINGVMPKPKEGQQANSQGTIPFPADKK